MRRWWTRRIGLSVLVAWSLTGCSSILGTGGSTVTPEVMVLTVCTSAVPGEGGGTETCGTPIEVRYVLVEQE